MNLKRMLLLLALSAAISAVAGPQKVKTSVEKVTLFIDGAQVTRTRQVDLPAGNSTVVFTGLSPYLDDKSMQVSAKGPFTVTAVNRLFNHTDSLERSTRQKTLEETLEETQQQLDRLKASTQIMITPLDYEFRIVHNIVTNFHQPKSTLLLLVSAFVGDGWRRIYDYALGHGFRFLSYGDSSVLLRE